MLAVKSWAGRTNECSLPEHLPQKKLYNCFLQFILYHGFNGCEAAFGNNFSSALQFKLSFSWGVDSKIVFPIISNQWSKLIILGGI